MIEDMHNNAKFYYICKKTNNEQSKKPDTHSIQYEKPQDDHRK